MTASLHESYAREEETKLSSPKSFGLVFFGFCVIMGSLKLYYAHPWYLAWYGAAAFFLFAAYWFPRVLVPLNIAWSKFGFLLHRIMNPLILGLMFYACVTPTGAIMRLCGKDLLRYKLEKNARSYWIERTPPGPEAHSITRQF